jgi:Arc/MetJ-type ribon-helix-helix transcriptional regulator
MGDEKMTEILTIDFSADLQAWIDQRLAEGRHIDTGDYLRDLIRRDQEGILGNRSTSVKAHRSD